MMRQRGRWLRVIPASQSITWHANGCRMPRRRWPDAPNIVPFAHNPQDMARVETQETK